MTMPAQRSISREVTDDLPRVNSYMSTTKKTDTITNPQGKSLGGEYGRVRIDLFQVAAKNIFDLTTRTGQARWELSDPGTPKMRQAFEDVVRTQEVLVRGNIPRTAIQVL
jgi:hypothetical protein